MNTIDDQIQALAAKVSTHTALNNSFYDMWIANPLTLDEVEFLLPTTWRAHATPPSWWPCPGSAPTI